MRRGELTRSRNDRMLAGVAGGMAEYFGVEPLLIRIAWLVAATLGFGLILYPVLWIVLPQGPGQTPAVREAQARYARGEIDTEQFNEVVSDLKESAGTPNTSALRVLEETYARGQTSREEFLRRRKVLAES
jgi:phage shock protein C